MFGIDLVAGAAAGTWDIANFLTNSSKTLGVWFNLALLVIGLVAVFWAAWQIVTGLMSHGKKQINWAVSIILLLVGGVLASSTGFDFVKGIAGGGKKTIEDLGTGGTIIFDYINLFTPFM